MGEDDFLEAQYEDRTYMPDLDWYEDDYYDDDFDYEEPFCPLHDAEHQPGGFLCELKVAETFNTHPEERLED